MPFSADFDLAELSEHVCQELDLETSKNLRQHDDGRAAQGISAHMYFT